jgi:hypothetical protein
VRILRGSAVALCAVAAVAPSAVALAGVLPLAPLVALRGPLALGRAAMALLVP